MTAASLRLDVPAPPAVPLSFEEFVAWLDEDIWAEWEDGKVTLLSANTVHQRLVGFLLALFQLWIEGRGTGGVVLTAPFLMRAVPGGAGREPDLLYIAPEHEDRLSETRLEGPADIVVEVISPESRRRDRNTKFFEYERAGVREYWVLDPETEQTEFYQRDDTGLFRRVALTGTEEAIYTSPVLGGLTLDTRWLWQRPLPTLKSVLVVWDLE